MTEYVFLVVVVCLFGMSYLVFRDGVARSDLNGVLVGYLGMIAAFVVMATKLLLRWGI